MTSPDHRQAGEAGFTLLEVLVVLVVFTLLQLALWEGLHLGLAAWQRQQTGGNAVEQHVTAEETLRRLVAHAWIGDPETGAPASCAPDRFAFVSSVEDPSSPLSQAGQHDEKPVEVALGRDRDHRLVLRWRDWINGEPLGRTGPYRETVLLGHVSAVTFGYLGPAGQWLSACSGTTRIAAVSMHVQGDSSWPSSSIVMEVITSWRHQADEGP